MEWARRIKAYRQRMGYKQTAAAEVLGVSQATLSKWESGQSEPTIAAKALIHKVIGGGGDQDTLIAQQKFWIEHSNDRHVIFKPLSSKLLAISPPSRQAIGLQESEVDGADLMPRLDQNQTQLFEAAHDILARCDHDVLRITADTVHFDPRAGCWFRSQNHVMPLFTGATVYPHLYVAEKFAIDETGDLPTSCVIHTVYGEETYTFA